MTDSEELDLGEIEPGQSPEQRQVDEGAHPWAPSQIQKYEDGGPRYTDAQRKAIGEMRKWWEIVQVQREDLDYAESVLAEKVQDCKDLGVDP